VVEGMTYQMVQMSFGDPEQKKNKRYHGRHVFGNLVLPAGRPSLVLNFVNGSVGKVQVY